MEEASVIFIKQNEVNVISSCGWIDAGRSLNIERKTEKEKSLHFTI